MEVVLGVPTLIEQTHANCFDADSTASANTFSQFRSVFVSKTSGHKDRPNRVKHIKAMLCWIVLLPSRVLTTGRAGEDMQTRNCKHTQLDSHCPPSPNVYPRKTKELEITKICMQGEIEQ